MTPTDDQLRETAREIDPRVPERIWLLLNEGLDGEHVWSNDPEPSDEGHDAVEYVQAASRQPLSGVEEVLKVLEPFARLAAQCQRVGLTTSSHVQAAADLHARLSAQAGGEKAGGKWSEYMRSDAGQLEVEKQYAAALREEVDELRKALTDARERTATVLNDLDDERRHLRAKDAEITQLKEQEKQACEYLVNLTKGQIGCGETPILNLIASHVGINADRLELRAEITRLREALRWALGEEGEFPERRPGEGAYWWRKELRKRAALAPQGQEGPEQASGPSDTEMLDWLASSDITPQQAANIVNGYRWDDKYRGDIRNAIRATMKASGEGMEG